MSQFAEICEPTSCSSDSTGASECRVPTSVAPRCTPLGEDHPRRRPIADEADATAAFAPNITGDLQNVGPTLMQPTMGERRDILTQAIDAGFPGNHFGPTEGGPAYKCPDQTATLSVREAAKALGVPPSRVHSERRRLFGNPERQQPQKPTPIDEMAVRA